MDKIHKPCDSECYTPSSEPFAFNMNTPCRRNAVFEYVKAGCIFRTTGLYMAISATNYIHYMIFKTVHGL
jgi:hypothetical protein